MKLIFLIILVILLFIFLFYKHDNFTCVVKKRINYKTSKIIKKIKKNQYFKIKKLYETKLKNFDFIPKMEFDDLTQTITEDYYPSILTKKNKPEDFEKQLLNIKKVLKKNKLYHNDLHYKEHIRLKKNKIYIIDFDSMSDKESKFGKKMGGNNILKIIKKYY